MANGIDSAVWASLISAISAIIVALINYYGIIKTKTRCVHKRKPKLSRKMETPVFIEIGINERRWIMIMCIFIPWLIFSPILLGISMGIFNLFIIIPVFTVILAMVYPIKPLTAVFAVVAVHPLNLYLTEFVFRFNPGNNSRAATSYYKPIIYEFSNSLASSSQSFIMNDLPWILLIILINIVIIYMVCRYRIKKL